MNEPSHFPKIDPQLEARIVALVLGEASDFERDELNRLIEERPELAALQKEMQNVHGMLRDVATGETVAEDEDWKLSAEKRSAVLAVISGESEEQTAKQMVTKSAETRKSVKRNWLWNVAKIAAVFLCIAGFFGSVAMPRFFTRRSTDSAPMKQIGLALHSYHSYSRSFAAREESGEPPLLRGGTNLDYSWNYSDAIDVGHERLAYPAADAEFYDENNSKPALSALRDSLATGTTLPSPHYLSDDVQYFPAGPEFKAPPEVAALRAAGTADYRERTSAEGVHGAKPPADGPALIINDEAVLSDGHVSNGSRSTNSRPPDQDGDGGELSFPNGADGPVSSTVTVPDGGTVLLGGIERRIQRQFGSGGKTVEAGRPTAVLGEGERKSESFLGVAGGEDFAEVAEPSPSFQDSGQGPKSPQAQPQQPGGMNLSFPIDIEDSLAAGKEKRAYRIVASAEDGLGGGGRTVPTKKWAGEIAAEHKPAEITRRKSDASFEIPEPDETAASQRMVADIDDRTRNGRAENRSGKESLEGGFFYADGRANSQSSPTNQTKDYFEHSQSKGQLAGADEEDGFASKSDTIASEDITLPKSGILNDALFGDQQMSVPVTGIAIGQSRGELQSGQVELDLGSGDARNSKRLFGRNEQGTGTNTDEGLKEKETAKPDTTVPLPTFSRIDSDSPVVVLEGGAPSEGVVTHEIERRAKHSLAELSVLNKFHRYGDMGGESLPENEGKDAALHWGVDTKRLTDEQSKLFQEQPDPQAIAGQGRWHGYVPPMLKRNSESIRTASETKSVAPAGLNEINAGDEAFSTFSLHVSDVSFKLARAALARGEWPEAAKVRIEEFVNAFDYGDPMPSRSEKVACRVEQSIHPFLQQRNVLRVAMRTAAAGRSSNTPLRLTFLLDNSGSMERIDRQQTVRRAFALLAQQLKPIDQVTLISFARQPRLLADKVSGAQSHQLVQLIESLPSEGGTNIEAALQLAFEKAAEQRVENAQNRIILLTDGAVNLGNANPENLSRMIVAMRGAGIAFDAAGISAEGLNDEILEALARKGDGRYYLLDSLEDADDGFVRQIAGALRPSAKNVKVQVEFNPKRVGRYKLLGFEKHLLKQEDFRNDKVDAAEMAAAEAGVAVYQFEAKPNGEGDVGSVSVRFRDLSSGQMIENCWPIPYEADAPRLDQANPSLCIATSAALLAAKLRGEPLGESVDLNTLSNLISALPDRDRNDDRVGQLQQMIEQARQVSGK